MKDASNITPQSIADSKNENVFTAVHTVSAQLEAIEKFITRRFDEISMEINATAQQVDMAEEGLGKRFGEIFEVLGAISHKGDGSTPANAGVELDAVVDMTEEAANRILDAAGRINSRLHAKEEWKDEESRERLRESISADVEEIFLSCSFQDLTGQRIRKTLENLKTIEDRLNAALDKLGIHVTMSERTAGLPENYAKDQSEIDSLFSTAREKSAKS